MVDNSRYAAVLDVMSRREADALFARLVQENLAAAGSARQKKEAEAIERRNIAHFIAGQDAAKSDKARTAGLFGVSLFPDDRMRPVSDPRRGPPRPGPHVSMIGSPSGPSGPCGLTDGELEILRSGGFQVDGTSSHSVVGVVGDQVQPERPRRDRWKPWSISSSEYDPEAGWRPWKWIEI
jgi:hypothetical protein